MRALQTLESHHPLVHQNPDAETCGLQNRVRYGKLEIDSLFDGSLANFSMSNAGFATHASATNFVEINHIVKCWLNLFCSWTARPSPEILSIFSHSISSCNRNPNDNMDAFDRDTELCIHAADGIGCFGRYRIGDN